MTKGNKILCKKITAIFVMLCFLFSLGFPLTVSHVEAWSDSGLPISKGADVGIPEFNGDLFTYGGVWNVYDQNGSKIGETAIVYEKSNKANGYNFIRDSQLSSAVRDMNGNPSFASSKLRSETLSYSGGSQSRYWMRDVAKQCGGYVEGFSQGRVNVVTTENPTGNITPPYSPSAGSTEDISFTAESHVHNLSGYGTRIDWKLYVSNNQIESGWKYGGIDEIVPYTFNSEGTYEIKLKITDQVQRTSVITETVTVGSGGSTPAPDPPQPPPYNPPPEAEPGDPVADFDMPSTGQVEEPVDVVDNSWSPDGEIVQWDWSISPSGSYDDDLGDTGGEIVFMEEGYFTVSLTVIDSNGNFDSTSESIRIEDNREPPNAYFRVSDKEISYGSSINVFDESTPGSAPIIDWDWDIEPSTGVTDTLDDTGGTVQFDEIGEYTITLTVEDDNGFTDSYDRTIDVINMPPEADFDITTETMQGENVIIQDESTLGDSPMQSYEWDITYPTGAEASDIVGELPGAIGEQKTFYFDKEGSYTLKLTITDSLGDSDSKEITVNVKPAIPVANFNWDGYWKQNRLVTFTNNSTSTTRYPIDIIQWDFKAVSGGAQDTAIKIDEDGNLTERRVIFKQPGNYNIKLSVTNTAGHSDSYEKQFEIEQDRPPEADFNIQSAYLRDPNNSNIASIQLKGESFSPDGDKIVERNWRYKYDSNNDGSFNDETWIYPGDDSWAYVDSAGTRCKMQPGDNIRNPIIETKDVGKYYVELEVVEGFGQPTISKFIDSSDILSDDTFNKPMGEKTGEVINARPSVGFNMKKKKKADIIFTIGDVEPSKVDNLQGLINYYLKSELDSENVDYGTIQTSKTSTVSSNDAGASTIFNNWQKYPLISDSKFDAGWGLSGDEIYTSANVHWTGFWDNEKEDTGYQEIKFDVMTDTHLDPWGFTFRMRSNQTDVYSFYAVEWTPYHNEINLAKITRWKPSSSDPTHGGPLYHGTISAGVLDDCSGEVLVSKSFDVQYGRWDQCKIIADKNHIQIWVNGQKLIDYYDNDNPLMTGSYGPYTASQYNTHFKNVSITTGDRKTLDEVLKEPSWRDDALHFIVDISDIEYPEFKDNDKAALIYSRLLNDEIDFSVLGTANNKAQAEDVISKNDGNGKFVYNNNPDMEQAIQQISTHIINKINDAYSDTVDYVLLNEEVIYKTFYNDNESDPKYAERWKYEHDPWYFENSMGEVSYSGQWKGGPIYRFGKVGEFTSTFQAQDNPKDDDRFAEYRKWSYLPSGDLKLKVHRRPQAEFILQLQN